MTLGLHTHLGKGLFLQEDKFKAGWSNWSIFTGIGIPDPLGNLYLGISFDPVPGLKLISGLHFYRYTKYSIINNEISDKSTIYRTSFPFLSLNIDPVSFIKAIGIFKPFI